MSLALPTGLIQGKICTISRPVFHHIGWSSQTLQASLFALEGGQTNEPRRKPTVTMLQLLWTRFLPRAGAHPVALATTLHWWLQLFWLYLFVLWWRTIPYAGVGNLKVARYLCPCAAESDSCDLSCRSSCAVLVWARAQMRGNWQSAPGPFAIVTHPIVPAVAATHSDHALSKTGDIFSSQACHWGYIQEGQVPPSPPTRMASNRKRM